MGAMSFNPHPREAGDIDGPQGARDSGVSIHTRVKRVTADLALLGAGHNVSIHTRVKRVTPAIGTTRALRRFQSTPA